MKKIVTLILFSFTLNIFSQEIDQEYLDTLPDAVGEDLAAREEARDALDDPVYRRASTELDKTDEDLDQREVFGDEFFDTFQSSFMPINEPNLDDTYVLDYGDVLEIQLIGQQNTIETYLIKRDGSISIPDIGRVSLSGLSLGDAIDLIKAKIDTVYIGTQAYISLVNIRDISILISGNAFNPGIYTLNGNSNILHALSMAGGINEYGSYRHIKLIRNNEVIDELDIYDVLLFGRSSISKQLRTGDSIFVSPRGKLVSIESGVNRPALYELKDDENLSDLLNFSNGLTIGADPTNIKIKSSYRGSNDLVKVDYDKIEEYEFKNGDSVYIKEYKYCSVSIEGAVINPGTYRLPLGTKLSELINIAGGYEDSAYPFAGYLNNQKALEINTEAREKLYNSFLNNLINASTSAAYTDGSLPMVLEQLRDSPVTGRVIAEFDLSVLKNNPDLDTILEDGDEIIIPNITQQVFVQGEVSNPGAIRYSPKQSLDYYISASGGALKSSDLKTIYIVHPNGETKNFSVNSRLSFLATDNTDIFIYPGSVIYVPKSASLQNGIEVAAVWAPIISSIALSVTSLSVLNNN